MHVSSETVDQISTHLADSFISGLPDFLRKNFPERFVLLSDEDIYKQFDAFLRAILTNYNNTTHDLPKLACLYFNALQIDPEKTNRLVKSTKDLDALTDLLKYEPDL